MALKKLLYGERISEFMYSIEAPFQSIFQKAWLASAKYLVSSPVDASHVFWRIGVPHYFDESGGKHVLEHRLC